MLTLKDMVLAKKCYVSGLGGFYMVLSVILAIGAITG